MILFGFGSNVFGYTWKVVNNTDEDLDVILCPAAGTGVACAGPFPILKSKDKIFSFDSDLNLVSIDEKDIKKFFTIDQLGLTKDIRKGGDFSIVGNSNG